MLYMLDTNTCIYLIKRQPPAVGRRFETMQAGQLVMSVVTFAELRYGVELNPDERVPAEQALAALVERVPVLPFDQRASVTYGVIRAAVRGRERAALDRIIAAHAISANAVLVTNNTGDFKDYPGLVLENWVETP